MVRKPYIPEPRFDSAVVEHVLVLSGMRSPLLTGVVHPVHFYQLKRIFQFLESIQSARIEGNRTTVDEFIEEQTRGEQRHSESILEIQNLEDAALYLEDKFIKTPGAEIDHLLIKELHRITVKHLRDGNSGGEGDDAPGAYRSKGISIVGSAHKPPPPWEVQSAMDDFVSFINGRVSRQMELLRIAVAHHHFTYIHPFGNGNGRVARLLTYGMLLKAGYRGDVGRILNPTAVFVRDREAYMNALQQADEGTEDSLLYFCEYVLGGLRQVFESIQRLTDMNYVESKIMTPAFNLAEQRGVVSSVERNAIEDMWRQQLSESRHVRKWYPSKSAASISHVISDFKHRKLIRPYPTDTSRKYIIELEHGPLLRCVIHALHQQGFLPFAPDA